jgi:predicted cupin superfamily sugar epimerase
MIRKLNRKTTNRLKPCNDSVYLKGKFLKMLTIEEITKLLDLKPHPEGGFYKETYRSAGLIDKGSLPEQFSGPRNYSTSIYFLLTKDTFSAFHKIHQDEFWHFYDGSPIDLHMISPYGEHSQITIGRNLKNGQVPQFVVPGGYWFASRVLNNEAWALAGCTVSPGFDFDDFDLAERVDLTALFPKHHQIISELTRDS